MRDLCVAAVLMRSKLGRPDANLSRMASFVRDAAAQGVDILCFPEACITGYGVDPSVQEHADTIPGSFSEAVLEMAANNSLTILAGLIERVKGAGLYLSHFVASPEGLLGIYRKTHLGPPEQGLFQSGNETPVFKRGDTTFGIELCYDAHFPELSTQLTRKGAEILFLAHASPRGSPKEKASRWMRYMPARALDNAVFVVACNQTGKTAGGFDFPGVALIIDPRGRVIAEYAGWEERIIVARLEEEALSSVRVHPVAHFFRHRRPEIYTDET